jgi:hyperosmotically inducible protein
MKSFLKTALLSGFLFALPSFADTTSSPDSFITAKTKLALWTTAGVRSTTVHVDTVDGVVTLHGKLPTAEQRALAETTTRGIEGVKNVNDFIQIVPAKEESATARSDKEISDASMKVLKNDAALKNSQISVKSVDKGVVLLTGKAISYGDYLRAVSEVDRVPGVRRVASEVSAPGDYRSDERGIFRSQEPITTTKNTDTNNAGTDDSRISMAVKMRLWTAPEVPSTEISVDTDNAVVTLFGMVPSAAVSDAATAEAKKVSGVKRVDNQLEVVSSAEKKAVEAKDADITRDLALKFKDRPEQKNVSTSVKNGTVMLTGTVSSGWAQLNAVRMARSVPGVRSVENQLKTE